MRWSLSLQIAVGLAALFGFGYLAIGKYVEPPSRGLVSRTAEAEASGAVSHVALEWQALRSAQESVVRAAAESPVLASLGASASEGRETALKVALEGLVAQGGGRGEAALIDASEHVLAATKPESGARLAQSAAVKDALLGSSSVRLERGGGAVLVSSAPILSGGAVQGALVLTAPIDPARITLWTGQLPFGSNLVLLSGNEVVASTLGGRMSSLPVQGDRTLEVDGERYSVDVLDLMDDGGPALRAFGLSKEDRSFADAIIGRVQFLVATLGALSVLVALAVVLLAPLGPAPEEDEAPLKRPSLQTAAGIDPSLTPPPPDSRPVMPLSNLAATQPPIPKMAFSPKESPPRTPVSDGPRLSQGTGPLPAAPSAPYSGSGGVEALPLAARKPVSGPTDGLGVPAPGRQDPAFDAIAQAAMSYAPPPPRREAPSQAPFADIASDENLPIPVEHMSNLPAVRGAPPGGRPIPAPTPAPPPPVRKPMSDVGRARPDPAPRSMPPQQPAVPLPPSQPPQQAQPQRWGAPVGTAPTEDPWKNPMGAGPMDSPSMRSVSGTITNVNQPIPQFNSARPAAPASGHSAAGPRDPVPFDEDHYRVVYNEFVGSKARLGEVVDNITYEGFSTKLRNSERELIERHGCKAVRFQVLVKDRQVSLRPQLVR